MVDRRQDALRGALTYLGDAERRIRGVQGDHTGWAVMEQLYPDDTRIGYVGPGTRRPEDASMVPLMAPAWGWMLLGAVALGFVGSLVSLTIVAAIAGALLGLGGRFWFTLRHADQLRRPSEEANAEIHVALGEAARFMHEAGVDWVGGDPSVVAHPWQMLAPVQETAAALRAELPDAAQS